MPSAAYIVHSSSASHSSSPTSLSAGAAAEVVLATTAAADDAIEDDDAGTASAVDVDAVEDATPVAEDEATAAVEELEEPDPVGVSPARMQPVLSVSAAGQVTWTKSTLHDWRHDRFPDVQQEHSRRVVCTLEEVTPAEFTPRLQSSWEGRAGVRGDTAILRSPPLGWCSPLFGAAIEDSNSTTRYLFPSVSYRQWRGGSLQPDRIGWSRDHHLCSWPVRSSSCQQWPCS